MSAMKDKYGRPVVVITGSGLITSLGAGKSDNWNRLISGESGIHAINRFSTDGLKTKIAGTIDFLPKPAEFGTRDGESALPRSPSKRRSRNPGSGRPVIFPGLYFSRLPRTSSNGRSAASWRKPPASMGR